MRIVDILENKKGVRAPIRPRNFVAKNAMKTTSGAGAHRDKKKEQKQGYEKHKGKELAEGMDEGIGGTIIGGIGQFFGNKIDPLAGEIMRAHGEIAGRKAEYTIRKYIHLLQKELKQQLDSGGRNDENMKEASDFGEPREILEDVLRTLEREVEWPLTDVMDPREVKQLLAPLVKAVNDKMMSMNEGRRDYGYDDFGNSLRPGDDEGSTEPPNNFAIYINGKKWKVFQGRGQYADDQYEMQQFRQLQAMAARKSQETGKKWEVARTGEPATKESIEKSVAETGDTGTTEKQILTRIRQIMYDRKLSGTESNAGELNRLKQQLKDIRSQQGVSEGDEPDEQYLDKVISDLHKDALGFRPDQEFGREWMSSSFEEKLEIYHNLLKSLHSDMDEGKQHGNKKIYDKCWTGYKKVPGKKRGEEGSCKKV